MITRVPDRSLSPERLVEEVAAIRAKVREAQRWRYCEKYVDRGRLRDPFYVLDIAPDAHEPGDVTADEPLFRLGRGALRIKSLRRRQHGDSREYWQAIDAEPLSARLDHFVEMYRNNQLEPPGVVGGPGHRVFEMKRFVYRIRAPGREIVGFGPAAFAGHPTTGAVRGRLVDANGQPRAGVIVRLVAATGEVLERTSDEHAQFLFSCVRPGSYRIEAAGEQTELAIESEPFGGVRGRIGELAPGRAGGDLKLELEAADKERFDGSSDGTGAFDLGLVPAGTYTLRIPDLSFSAEVRVDAEEGLGG